MKASMGYTERTVTLLLTDIEESTSLWESRGGEMARIIAEHEQILHEAVHANAGSIFKNTGDGVCAVFDSANRCVEAAVAGQVALDALAASSSFPIKVRMGMHTGVVLERGGDYFGDSMNRVARLLDLAHGGQIVVSSATHEQLRQGPASFSLKALGAFRLRGISTLEDIFQVMHAQLEQEFPPLRAKNASNCNLPESLTSFVGRVAEVRTISTFLEGSRLVTLVGPGGIGKTRLAVESASEVLGAYDAGVWFVSLESLGDEIRVPEALAKAFGISGQSAEHPFERLLKVLQDRQVLLIIDNCEHVIAECAACVRQILAVCRKLSIIATSREPLGIGGEIVFPVPPLELPGDGSTGTAPSPPNGRPHFEAIKLFTDRALTANPSFRVTDSNINALCMLVRRLDGIPLALELAAAQTRHLTVEQIFERIEIETALLASCVRGDVPRHKTLEATMGWSYDLLGSREKGLFCLLSIFSSGWTLEAAEHMASSMSIKRSSVLPLLSGLLDKSLVVAEERNGAMRYRMLETIKQYGRKHLHKRRLFRGAADGMLRWMTLLGKQIDDGIRGHNQLKFRRLFDLECDNFRASLDWALGEGKNTAAAAELAFSVSQLWLMNGQISEGYQYFQAIRRKLNEVPFPLNITINTLAGAFSAVLGDEWGLQLMRKASCDAHESGDVSTCVFTDKWLASMMLSAGQVDEAEQLFARVLELLRASPDSRASGYIRLALGGIAMAKKEYDAAQHYFKDLHDEKLSEGDQRGVGLALCYLAHVSSVACDEAQDVLYSLGIQKLCEVEDLSSLAGNVAVASALLLRSGSPEIAAQLQGFSDRLFQQLGTMPEPLVSALSDSVCAETKDALGEPRYREEFEDGRFLNLEQVSDFFSIDLVSNLSTPVLGDGPTLRIPH